MRKTVMTFAILLVTGIVAKAQVEKNTLLIGGSASFTTAEGESSFFLNPNVGVFVIDRLAVGVNAFILTAGGNTSWSLGPFGRYYFGKNESGKPFAGLGFGISGVDGSDPNFGVNVGGGYAIFLNKSIALEFSATYSRIDDFDQLGIGAGFQIHFRK